jgi:hypothetical protein
MRALICLVLVAACGASPAPQYFGATRSEIVKDGITFVVFHKENQAEVVRLGYLTRRERAAVPALMVQAAEQATSCRVVPGSMVTGLPGDTGEARFRLSC